ncbi:MAG: PAS domain-containing protein [Gammaproteobacteria bacterium]|jgi:PAS domain-containing protein
MAAHELLADRAQQSGQILDSLLVDVLQHSQDLILIVDAGGQILRASTGASTLFGAAPKEMLNRTLDSLPLMDDHSKACPSLSKCIGAQASKQAIVYEGVYINSIPSESAKRFDLKILPCSFDATGGALIFIVESRLPERHDEADQVLQRCFDVVQNSAEGGIWEWDPSRGRFREFGLWQAGLGYSADESCKTLADLFCRIHPDDRDGLERVMGDLSSGRSANFKLDCRQQHKNGTYRWFRCHGEVTTANNDKQPILISGTFFEISDLKEIAAQLLSKELELNLVLEGSRQGPPGSG